MKQRSDLTFKHNRNLGRHGWLRLTPAYSVKVVEEILDQYGSNARRVFEPFSGTGTTPLCAAYRGLDAVSLDINPFLIWLGQVKTAQYSSHVARRFSETATQLAEELKGEPNALRGVAPPIRNIERWWGDTELRFVTTLHHEISGKRGKVGDLLKIAFCRTMIGLSNAAFNHQSMSFKERSTAQASLPFEDAWEKCVLQFVHDSATVAASLSANPSGTASLKLSDSRAVNGTGKEAGTFDLLVTSPPYPNRMSYIRELRPYMYWLGFLREAKTAGELDWEAIGGTWGIATSRLQDWTPTDAFVPSYLQPILEKIRLAHEKNGNLMAQYVHKYFDDMFHHFGMAFEMLSNRGTAHYIIGNSTFYGHIVPAERLYVDQMKKVGFREVRAVPIRKRNSKKELVEFHVSARK